MVKINRSGYGCSVGKVNIGAVAYADDICLLSGSSYGLQQFLHICSTFAVERHLVFNSSKTKSHPSTPFTINLKEPLRLCYVVYYKHFSAVFYGCQLWCCSDSQLHKVRVA